MNRITNWLTSYSILNEFQAGFRKGYSTIDNVFNLVNIVHLNKLNNKYTYAFFVDFSSAFDLIPRNSLFYKLSCMGMSSKIIRILKLLYENTSSRIWDGISFSEYFTVETGVKQGCILSPVLFSLYLNDLPQILPGGVHIADTNIKILLYADDIVILSDNPTGLQDMIDTLQEYCKTWSLKVNLSKSKILIFRNGPRIATDLSWQFENNSIEIVNSYTYLGVGITYNLSFKKYLQNRLSSSKMAVNSTWSKYIAHPKISKENKLKIFDACAKSIMFYAAQVWGYQSYDDVEKLFRFFIKKMLYLPNNTPNYMLYLETGFNSLFSSTLKLHFVYIKNVLNLSPQRLTRILAEKIIELNVYWAKEWSDLCQLIHYSPPNNNVPTCMYWKDIIYFLKIKEHNDFCLQASRSQFHDLYPQLDYGIAPTLTRELSSRATSLIVRARGGLLDLNSRCFRSNSDGLCSVCNMKESENTVHFIGICPVYKEFRLIHFGQNKLNANEVIRLLNGTNISSLYKYLETCIKYRRWILNEFDF